MITTSTKHLQLGSLGPDLIPRNQSLFDNSGNAAVASPERIVGTLPKLNMGPKNDGCQKESPIPRCHFQVPC